MFCVDHYGAVHNEPLLKVTQPCNYQKQYLVAANLPMLMYSVVYLIQSNLILPIA
jgi:hypothetical protein